MASVEDSIDLDFAEDELLTMDELSNTQQFENTAISVESSKPATTDSGVKKPEQKIRKSRLHTRIRYRSPPTSGSDTHSRSTSPYGGSRSYLSKSTRPKREKRLVHAEHFGISPPAQTVNISEDELKELYRSMGVPSRNTRYRLHSLYVRGVDGLSVFQIEKMFAEFNPTAVEMIDEASCNVIWEDRYTVAKMMLEMTKPLKRIRGGRQVEEGEVADSDDDEEEDGEMREEQGDDVTINMAKGWSDSKSAKADVIEIDVDQVEIPPGKWRVITKHVGHNRLIILRFSLREDLAKGRKSSVDLRPRGTSSSTDPDGYSYKWMNRKNRIRPGLNIFDEMGNELEWDYEHDTRFYEEPKKIPEEEKLGDLPAAVEDDETVIGVGTNKRKIKTRGRGAKRFKTVDDLMSGSGSLTADREDRGSMKRSSVSIKPGNRDIDEIESDRSDDRDPSPTPQPWDQKKSSVHLRITIPNRKK